MRGQPPAMMSASLLKSDKRHSDTNIQIVTDVEVTIENYFSVVGNIPRGRRTRGIFPTTEK